MIRKKKNIKNPKAFSLIEFAIVMTILSILITGALSISIVNINAEKIKITKDRMAEINKALTLYVTANQALPCPASIIQSKIADSTYGAAGTCSAGVTPLTGTGIYQSTTATELFYGMVPVRTLGLPNIMAEDGWGSKFSYIVNYRYTNATVITTSATDGFGGTNATNFITIREKTGVTQTIATNAVMAIISPGANKYGGFGASLTSQYNRSPSTDETDNDATISIVPTSGVYFLGLGNNNAGTSSTGGQVAFDNILNISSTDDIFDDIISYRNRNSLAEHINAVSIPCQGGTPSNLTLYSTTITWPAANYDQVVVATTTCPVNYFSSTNGYPSRPTRRCGAFGVWAEVVNPCHKSNAS